MTVVRKDLTGQRFGKLTVVSEHDPVVGKTRRWLCRCDCGGDTIAGQGQLVAGLRGGCKACRAVIHGHTRGGRVTPEYRAWHHMVGRCTDPNDAEYHRYGGRGIRVCARWRDDSAQFIADMGPRPSPGHSIDRIDNDGNYEPGNCRWATRLEQGRNKSTNRLVEAFGRTLTVTDWTRETGLPYWTIARRLGRGETPESALGRPK